MYLPQSAPPRSESNNNFESFVKFSACIAYINTSNSTAKSTISTLKVHVNANEKKNEVKNKGNSFARIMKRTNKIRQRMNNTLAENSMFASSKNVTLFYISYEKCMQSNWISDKLHSQ